MARVSSDRAQVTLPTDEQILITREFDAPKHLVYRAWTTPELVRRWWHANRGEMTRAEIDLRVGGSWRYVMIASGGFEVAFHGDYQEIVPNERLVSTEVFEGMPDAPAVDTTTFTEVDGGPHNIGWTHPEKLTPALLEFLSERGGPRTGRDRDVTAAARTKTFKPAIIGF